MSTDTPTSRSSRRTASAQSLINLVLLILILGILNYLGYKYYAHKDLSVSQFYTLSPKTLTVLKNLDSPVHVTTLLLDQQNVQGWEQAATLLKEYQRVGGKNFTMENVDPVYDQAHAVELQKRLHFDPSSNLVIFEYKGKARFVKQSELSDVNPMTGESSGFRGEQQFTTAIVTLVEGKSSKIYFTEGHGEHPLADSESPTGYGLIADGIKSENIETASVNLAQRGDVPPDADAVVIAGIAPGVSFAPMEAQALARYLKDNGKLFILLDPYMTLGLDDVLKPYGLAFDNDLVLYRTMTDQGQMTLPLARIGGRGFSDQPITAKFAQANTQLLLMGARSVSILKDAKGQADPKNQPLLQTDTDAWGWFNQTPGAVPLESEADLLQIKDRAFDPKTDRAGPVTIAAVYDGGTFVDTATKTNMGATRIIVVGSSSFVEKDRNEQVGTNFFINCVDWLAKKNAVLDITPKKPQEYGLSLSPMQFRTVTWTALFFVPGAALVLGILAWFSRRK